MRLRISDWTAHAHLVLAPRPSRRPLDTTRLQPGYTLLPMFNCPKSCPKTLSYVSSVHICRSHAQNIRALDPQWCPAHPAFPAIYTYSTSSSDSLLFLSSFLSFSSLFFPVCRLCSVALLRFDGFSLPLSSTKSRATADGDH